MKKKFDIYPIVIRLHAFLLAAFVLGSLYVVLTNQADWLIAFLTIPLVNILLIPLTRKNEQFDPSNPIVLILVSLLIGTVFRSFFIMSPVVSHTKYFMLMGQSPYILLYGILCLYLGLIGFVLGYCAYTKRIRILDSPIFYKRINIKMFIPVALILTMISVAAAFYYFKKAGVSLTDVNELSKKRHAAAEEGLLLTIADQLTTLILPIFYMCIIYMIEKNKKLLSFIGLFTLMLGFINVLVPFVKSSRTDALYVLINAGLIVYYLKKRIKKRYVVYVLGAGLALLIAMTVLRHEANNAVEDSDTDTNPFIIMVGSLNFLGVDKISQIVVNMPGEIDYQYGTTLFLWLLAPIPRSLWAGKPEISLGKVVGAKIYLNQEGDTTGLGVPPSFVGELYMDFGYLGIIPGMFVFGLLLRVFYDRLKVVRTQGTYGMLLYVLIYFPIALNLIGGDFSRLMVNAILSFVPLYVIIKLTQKSGYVRPSEDADFFTTNQ